MRIPLSLRPSFPAALLARTVLATLLVWALPAAGVLPQGAAAAPEAPSATTTSSAPGVTPSSTTTSAAAPSEPQAGVHGPIGEAPAGGEANPVAGNEAAGTEHPEPSVTVPAPEVRAQRSQPSGTPAPRRHHGPAKPRPAGPPSAPPAGQTTKQRSAPSPSLLTPPGWGGSGLLGAPISGVPAFFIESFRVPPFLLPIYQAAGTAYGIPWQVLAAINEVETDYGRDLSVSSAGAEGWMQFLPSSWATYGMDVTGTGYEDPYNPADAIFAAARYLAAAGGAQHIRAAVFAYNHSQAYVESVMLRAQLLGGTPPELLSALAGLAEARFPVHAPAHFSDGFPAPGLAGTVIDSQPGAPVIAVQDGQVTAIGDSPALGRYVSLRDAYGNTYTYAQLGSVATLYPVLEPRVHTARSARGRGSSATSRPLAPASAGVQPHSPLSSGAVDSSLAMGAASALETPPAPAPVTPPVLPPPSPSSTPRVFRAGANEVYLHALVPGVQVLAGTVLGHLAAGAEVGGATGAGEPHMLFQIRPTGAGAPLIDPKPILDGWVRLEATSVFRARGENPFLQTSPTVGQALLASKPQLEHLVLRDPAVHLPRCERGEVRAGEVDRRVLAALEFLSVSGLEPGVSPASCAHRATARGARNLVGGAAGAQLDIATIEGTPIAGHEGPGSVADVAVHRLLRLQGTMKPAEILSANSYPGADNTLTLPGHRGLIHVSFASAAGPGTHPARAAGAFASPLAPGQWIQLVARLGEIPEPAVPSRPSAAAIPDGASPAPSGASARDGAPRSARPAGAIPDGSSSTRAGG